MKKTNKRWIISAVCTLFFLMLVSVLAYLKLIATEIKAVPYYDSVGHFMLFGIFGFVAEMAFKGARRKVFGLLLPVGSTLVASYALIDESLQVFSTVRTFDLHDLACGLLGIVFFYFVSKMIK